MYCEDDFLINPFAPKMAIQFSSAFKRSEVGCLLLLFSVIVAVDVIVKELKKTSARRSLTAPF